MKTIRISMATLAIAVSAILGCSKADLTAPKQPASTASFSSETVTDTHICGDPFNFNLSDCNGVVQGSVSISNDESNLYVALTSTNPDLKIIYTTLVIGDQNHMTSVIGDAGWPKVGKGPLAPDYNATLKPEQSSYTYTIALPQTKCNYVSVFAKLVKRDPVTKKVVQVEYVYIPSDTKAGSKKWSTYVEYCNQDCVPPPTCGQLTTYTQGGYGNDRLKGTGSAYMAANFAAAFPNGIQIGDPALYTLTMTDAQSIANYLPTGSTAAALTQNYVNVGPDNVLAGQILTLALSVGFDKYDPNFGAAGVLLGDMVIGSGTFAGKTVSQFLAIANQVLGGTSNAYTPADVNATADAINNNYDNGTVDLGYLVCPNN